MHSTQLDTLKNTIEINLKLELANTTMKLVAKIVPLNQFAHMLQQTAIINYRDFQQNGENSQCKSFHFFKQCDVMCFIQFIFTVSKSKWIL